MNFNNIINNKNYIKKDGKFMKRGSGVPIYIFLWLSLIATVFVLHVLNAREANSGLNLPQSTPFPTATPSVSEEGELLQTSADDEVEMRGVWISYIALSTAENTLEAFFANYDKLILDAKEIGANAVFVQVRPFSDALYESDYFPWSHILTGTQGQVPEIDPMQYMIDKAHESGMQFHAWINPLRVKTETTPALLAQNNPYTILGPSNPYYFMEINGAVYLNPAYTEIRTMISDGVVEIVEKYNVDGIHFDDYFYPEEITTEDTMAYESYCGTTASPLDVEDWRVANINTLIAQVYREIKSVDKSMPFGISPQGNIANNDKLSADVKTWCSTVGYIDYIAPQIYFSYDNPYKGYKTALDEWVVLPRHSGLEVYIGLALYKAGSDTEDEGTWKDSDNMLATQIKDMREATFDGFILYESKYIDTEQTRQEVENIKLLLEN